MKIWVLGSFLPSPDSPGRLLRYRFQKQENRKQRGRVLPPPLLLPPPLFSLILFSPSSSFLPPPLFFVLRREKGAAGFLRLEKGKGRRRRRRRPAAGERGCGVSSPWRSRDGPHGVNQKETFSPPCETSSSQDVNPEIVNYIRRQSLTRINPPVGVLREVRACRSSRCPSLCEGRAPARSRQICPAPSVGRVMGQELLRLCGTLA